MVDDQTVQSAISNAVNADSYLQLYVQCAPGILPTPEAAAEIVTNTIQSVESSAATPGIMISESENDGSKGAEIAVGVGGHQINPAAAAGAIRDMHRAEVDPEDAPDYLMVSFYGFHRPSETKGTSSITIAALDEFAMQLQYLWKPFNARGRVYVAKEGVNAQMAVPSNCIAYFEQATRGFHPVFARMRLNVDPRPLTRDEYAAQQPFRALHVRVREQIVADGFPEQPQPQNGNFDWTQAGEEMSPVEWHRRLLEKKAATLAEGPVAAADPETSFSSASASSTSSSSTSSTGSSTSSTSTQPPIVLDCRNSYESDVGIFEGAIPLNTTFFRESWAALDDILKDTPKDTPILTYCTGGIRCVKINAYLQQHLGFNDTHRLAGGIIAYQREMEEWKKKNQLMSKAEVGAEDTADELCDGTIEIIEPSSSRNEDGLDEAEAEEEEEEERTMLFRGVNYVFDERIGERVSEDILTRCEQCIADTPCDQYTNCPNCNVRFLQCSTCSAKYDGCCSQACRLEAVQRTTKQQHQQQQDTKSSHMRRKQSNSNMLGRVLRVSKNEAQQQDHAFPTSCDTGASSSSSQTPAGTGLTQALSVDVPDAATEGLIAYSELHSQPEPALLTALRRHTEQVYGGQPGALRMLSDPLQGRILALLAAVVSTTGTTSGSSTQGLSASTNTNTNTNTNTGTRILELGTFTGYSAISMALALDEEDKKDATTTAAACGGHVTTCEPDPAAADIARRYIQQGQLQDKIDLRAQKANEVISDLIVDPHEPQFHMVFMDADKKQYRHYLSRLMGEEEEEEEERDTATAIAESEHKPSKSIGRRCLLRDGALIVVDNTLWKGHVLSPYQQQLAGETENDVRNNDADLHLQTQKQRLDAIIGSAVSRTSAAAAAAAAAAMRVSSEGDEGGNAHQRDARAAKKSSRLDALASSMHAFNVYVRGHPQLQPVLLPLRDG
eukprot:CAMPEP_0174985852 /NCGR_PEP_ID=MMETSP0004_2-20121128/18589_1 /TAXON_ID=420556 /ORGANISM="Ochromonas sp., Strain CCMP1393" /LENGTH=952 /DNA_ID=CAMNT_0016238581 /DNA_START=472 /DNA_END=3326 /DNA_ORIENTATION=-